MSIKPRRYLSFLLRMWQVQEAYRLVWRASLENPHTGEKQFFASLSQLYQFLTSEGIAPDATNPHPDPMEEEQSCNQTVETKNRIEGE